MFMRLAPFLLCLILLLLSKTVICNLDNKFKNSVEKIPNDRKATPLHLYLLTTALKKGTAAEDSTEAQDFIKHSKDKNLRKTLEVLWVKKEIDQYEVLSLLENENRAFSCSSNTLSHKLMTPTWFDGVKNDNKKLENLWREADGFRLDNCKLAFSLEDADFLFAQALIADSHETSRSKKLTEPGQTVYSPKKSSLSARDLILALCYQIKYPGHSAYTFNSLNTLVSFDRSCTKSKGHNTFLPSRPYAANNQLPYSLNVKFDSDTALAIERSLLKHGECSIQSAWSKVDQEENCTIAAFEKDELNRALEASEAMAPSPPELPEGPPTEDLATPSLELPERPSTEEMRALRVEHFKKVK